MSEVLVYLIHVHLNLLCHFFVTSKASSSLALTFSASLLRKILPSFVHFVLALTSIAVGFLTSRHSSLVAG